MGSNGNDYEEDDDYIKIASSEESDFMEFPKEEDGSLLLSTVQTQFPDAIGLKYKGSSGAWRAIREVDNVLAAPPKDGWGNGVYIVTVNETSRKRKSSVSSEDKSFKHHKTAVDPLLKDMAVIGLPFKLQTDELKEYFEKNYGETEFCEVKFDRSTGKSRGFGFVRFKDAETAKEAMDGEHYLMGRRVEVRLKKEKPMKLFVGRLPNGTTADDLQKHFSQYGELKDTYIPQPFRNFAFLTFASTEDGRACLRKDHEMNGARLNVMERNQEKNDGQQRDDRRGSDRRSGYDDRRRSSSGGSYSNRDNQRFQQPQMPMQNNMADELKSMLFQFLTSK